MTRPTVLVVGGDVIASGASQAVADLAHRTHTGVLNTWRAKGLFRFDDPAHLGTIGLQRDDLALAGLVCAPREELRLVVCGVGTAELPSGLAGGLPVEVEVIAPGDLSTLALDDAGHWPERPPLYHALAEVCGPRYHADDVPLSPVRAAGDLATWLPEGAVVTAAAGVAGFWLGRTFPTRAPGTVLLPALADPDFTSEVVDSASGGVVVVCGPEDRVPDAPGSGSHGWVVVERWLPDGPALTPDVRRTRLTAAAATGGYQVLEVGVAVEDLAPLENVAGPVVVWGGPKAGWAGSF